MLHRLRDALDRVLMVCAAGLLVALLVCVALGVVTRGFDAPLAWTDEISRFLMIWPAMFGRILGTRRRAHVRIRFFHDRLPSAGQRWLDLVVQLARVGFGLAVARHGLGLTLKNLDLEATTIEISMGGVYAPLIIAGAITAAQAVVEASARAGPAPHRIREPDPLRPLRPRSLRMASPAATGASAVCGRRGTRPELDESHDTFA